MDLTLLRARPLAGSRAEELDALALLQSPGGGTPSAFEPGTVIASARSDAADKPPEPPSGTSKYPTRGANAESQRAKPSSSSSNMPECVSCGSRDDDLRVHECFEWSESILPLSPRALRGLISPPAEIYAEHESTLAQGTNTKPQPFGSTLSTLERLTESSVDGPLVSLSAEPGQTARPLRSLSHRSDSLESDTALPPMSDLYIFESETQDFILSPAPDPREIKSPERPSSSQTAGKDAAHDGGTRVLTGESAGMVARWPKPETESDRSAGPPAVDGGESGPVSVNDARRAEADLTSRPRRADSPAELWLDARTCLAGEDADNRNAPGRTGCSVTPDGPSSTGDINFPPEETQVSDYPPEGGDGIGWSCADSIGWGPPVERWSSVDSWASALSDWTSIISSPPEDFTAAFTEIGAEIDALTQALAEVNTGTPTGTSTAGKREEPAEPTQSQPPMGVQDQPLVAQNIPETLLLSGQSCLSFRLEEAGPELRGEDDSQSVESLRDSTAIPPEEKEPEEIHRSQAEDPPCPSRQPSSTSGGGTAALIPGSTSSADADPSHFGPSDESLDGALFISHEDDEIVLKIIEDADLVGENASKQLPAEQPSGDGVCEVTEERSVSQLRSVANQEAKRSCGPAGFNRDGTEAPADPNVLTAQVLTKSHVPGAGEEPGLHANVHAHVSADTLADLDAARQVEPQRGGPEFIMPLAPLGISSTLKCWASSSSAGDQTRSFSDDGDLGRGLAQARPAGDGITDTRPPDGHKENTIDSVEKFLPKAQLNAAECFLTGRKTITEGINALSRELSSLVSADHLLVSDKSRVAVITLELNDPFASRAARPVAVAGPSAKAEPSRQAAGKMPHKSHKPTPESKSRSKKEKPAAPHHGAQASKKQESASQHLAAPQTCKQKETPAGENQAGQDSAAGLEDKRDKLAMEAGAAAEKAKLHGKKKKKHQSATGVKGSAEPPVEADGGAKAKTAKARIDAFEAKLAGKPGRAHKDNDPSDVSEKKQPGAKPAQGEQPPPHRADHKDHKPKSFPARPSDDAVKRRRLSEDKFGKPVGASDPKPPKPGAGVEAKAEVPKADAGAARRKAYSEVVKQTAASPKEEPKVVQPVQAAAVSGDPQGLCLWCQFAAVLADHTVTWRREGAVLAETKRSAGDGSRASLTIPNASHKDLGRYQCCLSGLQGSTTLDYLLTYEVLSEIVIPPSHAVPSAPADVESEEEDVRCSRLMFKDDFLSEQYFGENHPVSIITEKAHFGEGMHRRAFRTKLHTGRVPLLLPGHACVLKVHNSISYGTKDNDELVQKNFSLAVEECQVQNTAREYIREYTEAAKSVEAFGDVPDIIPIYLVHRPSNDIPYATLEEELIGDFVKYSVKDGREINLLRRDSEAGRKCCAFQHWVYHRTEGNLLVTDMQGVGMRLTDVGIATCKKGYKGFKGNCSTSFIDQFKALHQCNKYCEILGLESLQPKPRKPASGPKAKPQPSSAAPKKKSFGPTVKAKS